MYRRPVAQSLVDKLKQQLREERLRQSLSQAELADRLHVRQQMVAKFERPTYEPSLSQFERIASALGFTINVTLRRHQKMKGPR